MRVRPAAPWPTAEFVRIRSQGARGAPPKSYDFSYALEYAGSWPVALFGDGRPPAYRLAGRLKFSGPRRAGAWLSATGPNCRCSVPAA